MVLSLYSVIDLYGFNMKNNIQIRLNEIRGYISSFRVNPILDAQQGNLRRALFLLMNIDLSKEVLTPLEFKEYRVEMLKCHVEIIELFDKYYVENYKPGPYKLKVYPPAGSVDGPVFGSVDPVRIRDESVRNKYISDLTDNNKIGEMNAFQSALAAVKRLLENPDAKLGTVATVEWFIKYNYKDNEVDRAEVDNIINASSLSESIKNQIVNEVW